MNFNSPLFLLCSLAGVLLILGSLYLLRKGIIDFRAAEGVTEMEISGVGTIKTPVPALVMFVLGVFLVVFPVYKSPELCPDLSLHKKQLPEMVRLRGKVAADTDVEVYAIVDAQEAGASDSFVLTVPYMPDRYIVRYVDKSGTEVMRETFRLGPGEKQYDLKGVQVKGTAQAGPPRMQLEQAETANAVAEFK
jgi:hypothetical protein